MGAPGAFGMLDLVGGNGTVGASVEAQWILTGFNQYLPLGLYDSDPGAKFNSSQIQGALDARIGTVLLFPVFDTLTGNGSNAQYNIIGWVGFHLDRLQRPRQQRDADRLLHAVHRQGHSGDCGHDATGLRRPDRSS